MTIKQLLPELTEQQRKDLGQEVSKQLTTYIYPRVREDGNRVRDYPEDVHYLITLEAAKMFKPE